MKTPLIAKPGPAQCTERGVTMVLVAISMVAIIAIAALSIDVITLYLAKEEAQRSADTAALAAAKIISLSGITGDPNNVSNDWGTICGPDDGINGLATRVAKTVASQNTIGGLSTATPTITYSYASATSGVPDCHSLAGTGFAVNPLVTVSLTRTGLPTFFSRIWGYTGQQVTSTATAEAYNSSNSATYNQGGSGTLIPVQPRCVKPWIVPNQDPWNPSTSCTGAGCSKFVSTTDGSITHGGISVNTAGPTNTGVIGETFWLIADCNTGSSCTMLAQPQANPTSIPSINPAYKPNLLYVPGQVGTPVIGVPSCTSGDDYEEAIEGCDQPTNYSCGVQPSGNPNPDAADLTINPVGSTGSGPTTLGVACLTHQSNIYDTTASTGQDYLSTNGAFGVPNTFPFQINAGTSNPLLTSGLPANSTVSVSPSIVSLPIYDDKVGPPLTSGAGPAQNQVTFVGFLQVFINAVDQAGNINVTVLNVTGCSNSVLSGTSTIIGNSPVPVRLVTPPAQ